MVRAPACRSRGRWFESTSAVSKLGQFRSPLSEETLKAVGPNSCVSSRLGCLEYNYLRHGNMDEEYKMGDTVLGRPTQEKDLGVTFSADMKVSEQCGIAASKGNQILGIIRRTIMYKEKSYVTKVAYYNVV